MEHQHAEFVNTHYEALIQRVTSVMPIADKLYENKKLTWEVYSKITMASKKTQMRELLDAVKSGGPAVKSAFYEVLQEVKPDVIQELEGSSSQTDHEKQVTESHRQKVETEKEQAKTDRLKNNIIRWNRSSIKHRSKIEELQKDSTRKQVGNLYFSKSDEYNIGSGGTGKVFIGLKEDGTEVAIKRILKDQQKSKCFENELKHLQDLNLESKNVVRYVDLAEDEDFYYLALQLCEYDMEDYMEILRQEKQQDKALRKIVKEILLGLQVLHRAEVIHRDIKPGNVLIDSGKNARLADFGISRKLEDGRSTVHTARAGTRGWEATEILNQENRPKRYKMSSDIQVAGMLVYYILSDGKHPFGDTEDREENIKKGQHSLEDLKDTVAKDLIEWMINKEPGKRLIIDEVLKHPYFWNETRKEEVLRKVGDRHEVQCYIDILAACKIRKAEEGLTAIEAIERAFINKKDKLGQERKAKVLGMLGETEEVQNQNFEKLQKLCDYAENYTQGKTFSKWKSVLSEKLPNIDNACPEDLLGLLRTYRNKWSHAFRIDDKVFTSFPDFYISLYRLAKDMGWDCTWS
ncbi:uncharacterized protein LOC131553354 [Onychostoma macrolepis]|uniref:uncharacterized protein LOC131553354 n=1 Tax=Onychostoma macrolepis TaxID=369639 RepID=UPI00272D7FF1|nr:uncharacterized protein LOC131553354 [Onychostoma macrolepis]XP_058653944.1 uncharacterized protein LOC131553354 [Onychostoma macrolepis]XP_058653945.1 uncharacterized protein LOC131553354 [Onychostoma macrolepis]XP_058653946.1 uncharacterized protein LOC131553354 [Onychostoma macrolepis]XP_058653948.1 uncharacterized protein LOC131553354 [Onychostoma macrolepis]